MAIAKLPFGNNKAILHRTEADFLDGLRGGNRPIRSMSFASRQAQLSLTAGVRIGSLLLTAQNSSLAHFETVSDPQFTFILPITGSGVVTEGSRSTTWHSKGELLSASYHNHISTKQASLTVAIRPQLCNMFSEDQSYHIDYDEVVERLITSGVTLYAASSRNRNYYYMMLKLITVVDNCNSDESFLERIGLDGLFHGIMFNFIQENVLHRLGNEGSQRTLQDAKVIEIICESVLQNIGVPLTVSRMKALTGISSTALTKAFQSRFGCSPIEWQRNLLLDHARIYLERNEGSVSVQILARELGFVSAASFRYFFTKRFGTDALETSVLRAKEEQPHSHLN